MRTSYMEAPLDQLILCQTAILFRATRATDLFTAGTAGLVVGVFLFSAFADWKGRRLAVFISTAFMIVFNLIPIGISQWYPAYAAIKARLTLGKSCQLNEYFLTLRSSLSRA